MVTRIDGDAIFGNMVTVGAAETLACASAGHRRCSRRLHRHSRPASPITVRPGRGSGLLEAFV